MSGFLKVPTVRKTHCTYSLGGGGERNYVNPGEGCTVRPQFPGRIRLCSKSTDIQIDRVGEITGVGWGGGSLPWVHVGHEEGGGMGAGCECIM